MSRSGDLTAIVLDVGPSMSTKLSSGKSHLETAVKAIDLFVQQKVLHTKKDEVALITFGDNETDNPLASDGEYQHICVRRTLTSPDLDLLRFIETEIQPGDQPTDFVDALVVALDCLITGGEKKKGDKKIYMFTDAGSPVNDSSLDQIIDGMKAHGIDLRVIGVGIDEDGDEDDESVAHMTQTQKENVQIIKRIVDAVEGEIPVFLYTEEKREPRPTLKKLSALVDLDPTDADSAKVEREVTYHKLDEDETEVPGEERIKGYRYGRTIVPWEKMHEENLTLKPDKELSVICFTHQDNVPRHHQLEPLLCVLPAHDDEDAARGIACLAQALHEMESVAIVRYVFRNKAAPKLGMLFPTISEEYKGLYYVSLPFREDIRPYEFASLAKNKNADFDKEQRAAVEDVIASMDLMKGYVDEDGDEVEAYEPEYTFNPAIQMFYQVTAPDVSQLDADSFLSATAPAASASITAADDDEEEDLSPWWYFCSKDRMFVVVVGALSTGQSMLYLLRTRSTAITVSLTTASLCLDLSLLVQLDEL
ncbi:hypothetical protein PTSG_08056 [Salpingoeca rosetta]|uniref:VWFA domain-containing protein n=1 Tax=Salpingoeca rosetta (strain ATCC 50818 / BSB-021) TaxID=946362 RepID=F2UHV6_SALR5|nr:uncharacterized protein PTSG_08056 [Salpingoeca rosetta]EGD76705.1 hypothetical protein PTSG_08056 [Salpingoeca rosetta]|eukprot:XP_004991077.1 hypothetical protein PTSG_08056 [Salpingoeca rosetta]